MITNKLAWLTARSNGLASTGCDGSPARIGGYSARGIAGWMLWCGILLLGLLGACSKPPAVEERPVETAQPSAPAVRTTEFVVLIDNSKSIRPPEQVIIREATMLLADLADVGDRLSVIAFGDGARLVTSVPVQGDADRRAFKDAIRQQVGFSENLSDIRAGLRLLAEQRDRLFPTPGAIHAAILFSDGRLETRDRRIPEAFQQLRDDLKGPLAEVDLYAVVLGDTTSRQPIPGLTPPLTGLDLMAQHVARAPAYFYHARQIEQLPEVAVAILNKTKGISSLGEESGTAFRIDGTVRAMTLIVRKRPPNAPAGSTLPASQEIQLNPPESAPPDSIYRNSDYQHFDLFVVRQPQPGLWRVTRSDGGPVSVLSKIVSPIALQVQARPGYYLNEAGLLRAWLWDEGKPGIAAGEDQLQAHVANPGELAASQRYLPMPRDPQGQYLLPVPAALRDPAGAELQPGRVEVEIVAQRPADPWFLRRSPPFTLELQEPLIEWLQPDAVVKRLFSAKTLTFGGVLIGPRYVAVGFEVPPELNVAVERFDAKTGQFVPYFGSQEKPVAENDTLAFRLAKAFDKNGRFRYGYRLTGHTATGPVTIQSPWYSLRIDFFWELAAALGVGLVVVAQLLARWTAKLRGNLQIQISGPEPGFAAVTVRPCRAFSSTTVTQVKLGTIGFRIQPQSLLFLVKRYCVTVMGVDAKLDHQALKAGQRRCVKGRGAHTLTCAHPSGRIVTVTLNLRVGF